MQAVSSPENVVQFDFFQPYLGDTIPHEHPLRQLGDSLDWSFFESHFSRRYSPDQGRPGTSIRLLIGLLLLKYMYDVSDELAVELLSENGIWQYFCGIQHFAVKKYCDATSLVRFRQYIGEEGAELLLSEMVRLGYSHGVLKEQDLKHVHVDTTVQEKAIAYPHDLKHVVKMHRRLLKLLKKKSVKVKQSYRRIIPKLSKEYFFTSRGRVTKRSKKSKRLICTKLGRLVRAVERTIAGDIELVHAFEETLKWCKHFIAQAKGELKSNDEKVYSPHEPSVQCIAKGKVHKKYEFGNKVGIVNTDRNNFIIGCVSLEGRPADMHTLKQSLDHAEKITGKKLSEYCNVDRGYQGHGIPEEQITVISPYTTNLDKKEKKFRNRRPKVESVISLLKRTCGMKKNYLKGVKGDVINALCAAVAYNAKLIMREITLKYQ